MAIQVKAIRPSRLKPEAYKKEILKALGYQADQALRLYLATTRTWKRQPKFRIDFQYSPTAISRGGGAAYAVTTDDEIFFYVDQGTRPHTITARRAGGRLAFRTGFRAKTRPRILGSRSGSRFGSIVRPHSVRHPGTKARQFTQEIMRRRRRPFFKAMEKAHQKGLRAARRG